MIALSHIATPRAWPPPWPPRHPPRYARGRRASFAQAREIAAEHIAWARLDSTLTAADVVRGLGLDYAGAIGWGDAVNIVARAWLACGGEGAAKAGRVR